MTQEELAKQAYVMLSDRFRPAIRFMHMTAGKTPVAATRDVECDLREAADSVVALVLKAAADVAEREAPWSNAAEKIRNLSQEKTDGP